MKKHISQLPFRQLVLFGGSFDPFHVGHLAILEALDAHFSNTLIVIVPAKLSPFKSKHMFSRHQRNFMVSTVLAHLTSKQNNTFLLDRFETFPTPSSKPLADRDREREIYAASPPNHEGSEDAVRQNGLLSEDMCTPSAYDEGKNEGKNIGKNTDPSYTIDTVKHLKKEYSTDDITICIGEDNLASLHEWKSIDELAQLASFIVAKREELTGSRANESVGREVDASSDADGNPSAVHTAGQKALSKESSTGQDAIEMVKPNGNAHGNPLILQITVPKVPGIRITSLPFSPVPVSSTEYRERKAGPAVVRLGSETEQGRGSAGQTDVNNRDESTSVPKMLHGLLAVLQRPGLIIGLTGQVGTGKSEAGRVLEQHFKIQMLDLDAIGHDILMQDSTVKGLTQLFGESILEGGHISRPKLGTLVFSDSNALEKLNGFMHPKIRDAVVEALSNRTGPVVIMGALLEEIGLSGYCHHIICTKADPSLVKAHIGEEKFKRSNYQKSQAEFDVFSDYVMTNMFDGSFADSIKSIGSQIGLLA